MDYAALKAEAIALRHQGFSLNQIARRLGLQAGTIQRWVREVTFDGHSPASRAEQLAGYRSRHLYDRALQLRRAGYSYRMIEAELGVRRSTLHGWLKDEPDHAGVVRQRRAAAQRKTAGSAVLRRHWRQHQQRASARQEVAALLSGQFSARELFLVGLMLYWAEGAKTQSIASVTNSDPRIIKLFVIWLEQCLQVDRSQLRGEVHIYPDIDVDEAETYWSAISGIPRSQFYKAQVDQRSHKSITKRGKLKYGTLHVKVLGAGSTKLHRNILGWIEGFSSYIDQLS